MQDPLDPADRNLGLQHLAWAVAAASGTLGPVGQHWQLGRGILPLAILALPLVATLATGLRMARDVPNLADVPNLVDGARCPAAKGAKPAII